MKNQSTLFSSKTPNWGTPKSLLKTLKERYKISLDPCARNATEAVCERFYSPSDDGLIQSWDTEDWCFVNPPYSRDIGKWMRKCVEESEKGNKIIALVPARTDTKWFHNYVFNKASEIYLIKGRLKFIDLDNTQKTYGAPFPSMIVIYDKYNKNTRFNSL
jgi:phage N-6-adenine-methyltransferase